MIVALVFYRSHWWTESLLRHKHITFLELLLASQDALEVMEWVSESLSFGYGGDDEDDALSLSNLLLHITSIPTCKPYFSQFAISITPEITLVTVVMGEHLESDNMNKGNAIVRVQKEETDNSEKPDKCNQCDFSSSRTGNLKRHLKTHSGERSNKCSQCDYKSSRADVLRVHLKTHRGEKPNKCNQCEYASLYASNLRTHLKHTVGKSQTNATNMTAHPLGEAIWGLIWKHTVEKSNKCNQCDYASAQPGHLRRHLKIHG